MWALALAAVVTVFDVPWYDRAWELVDSDGMPYLAIVAEGQAEGELARGRARIRIGVTSVFTMQGDEIDVDDDGAADAIVNIDVEYDDGGTDNQIAIYTVIAGAVVLIHRFHDDVPRWTLTSVTAEHPRWYAEEPERWLLVERTNFRTRMVRGEIWVWNGEELVEDRSRRRRYEMPVGH
jgi:hypothetical protein